VSATVAASHAARKEKLKFALRDVTMLTTVGTGTFGRVRVVQYKPTKQYFAMKILKKSEVRAHGQTDSSVCMAVFRAAGCPLGGVAGVRPRVSLVASDRERSLSAAFRVPRAPSVGAR
jgi:serine/threonine protein kinase